MRRSLFSLASFDSEALKQYGRNQGKKIEATPSLINDDKKLLGRFQVKRKDILVKTKTKLMEFTVTSDRFVLDERIVKSSDL